MRFVQATPTKLIAHNSVFSIRIIIYILLLLFGIAAFYLPFSSAEEHLNYQLFGFAFSALGFISLLVYGRSVNCIFDRDNKSLTVRSRFLLISKTSMYPLADISCVEVESQLDGESDTRYFGISLHLKGGKEIHICPGFELSEYTAKEAVIRISSFLSS